MVAENHDEKLFKSEPSDQLLLDLLIQHRDSHPDHFLNGNEPPFRLKPPRSRCDCCDGEIVTIQRIDEARAYKADNYMIIGLLASRIIEAANKRTLDEATEFSILVAEAWMPSHFPTAATSDNILKCSILPFSSEPASINSVGDEE